MSVFDRTLIIDTTYKCNSDCLYCQWAVSNNIERPEPHHLFISPNKIKSLKIKRVVFSGGEPILSNDIERLVNYYSELGLETVIITNGILMSNKKASQLKKQGLKGITFSIDTLDPQIAGILRGTRGHVFSKIVRNLIEIRKDNSDLEIGINTTLTAYNVNTKNIESLLSFVKENGIDFIKFQPLFDDGFVGARDPKALLSSKDLEHIKENANIAQEYIKDGIVTNPPYFWEDLALFVEGKNNIDPNSCGALEHQLILFEDGLRPCYWRKDFRFDQDNINLEGLIERYKSSLSRCKVNYWCFCNQSIHHKWRWLYE